MESNQDQALMRGPPDHRANGPDIPLSGYVVSFSALLTCLSPRNSVRTCALARVEGSVPPTSGFGIRRSPLSYTRILFERVRICTSQRGSIGRVYLTTRPPGLPPSVSPYQSASTLSRHRSMVPPPASCGEERHICASRLDCHTVLGGPCTGKHGSFQQDSAGSYRPTQASGFHGWERPNIAGGLSCTAWELPCFWPLHVGGFRLYTLRRAQPLYKCRHTQWPS